MHTCTHIYIYICIVYVYMHAYIHSISIRSSGPARGGRSRSSYIYIYICIHIYLYVIHTYIYVYLYTHIHIYIYVRIRRVAAGRGHLGLAGRPDADGDLRSVKSRKQSWNCQSSDSILYLRIAHNFNLRIYNLRVLKPNKLILDAPVGQTPTVTYSNADIYNKM